MYRGTPRLVVSHASLAPCLVVFHVSCYTTSHENEDFHGNFLNFTREYLRVTMRGLPRVSEVTLELYRNSGLYVFMPKFAHLSQQYNKTSIIIVCSNRVDRSGTIRWSINLAIIWLLPSSHLIISHFDCTMDDCCHFTLLTASRMLYVWHDQYLVAIQYHALLLLLNLHHANCFYLHGCTLFNSLKAAFV